VSPLNQGASSISFLSTNSLLTSSSKIFVFSILVISKMKLFASCTVNLYFRLGVAGMSFKKYQFALLDVALTIDLAFTRLVGFFVSIWVFRIKNP